MTKTLVEVANLKKYFPIVDGIFRKHVGDVKAVDDISFKIYKGETLGLVGESGCGKTTAGRSILRLTEPTSGSVKFFDEEEVYDLPNLKRFELRAVRRKTQMIFQDPYASLNPRMTIQEIIEEPLVCYGMGNKKERTERVAELLQVVGLDPTVGARYPHAFSGGQRQRIGIARALALNPSFIVADEAVSALDVSIQAQIINLLQDLQKKLGLTYLFISHDLGVIEHICQRVAVMYVGKIVEISDTENIFNTPKHPYVEALLGSVPRPDPNYKLGAKALKGEVADPAKRPQGCAFHPRCDYATDICSFEEPQLIDIAKAGEAPHWVACHRSLELSLKGVAEISPAKAE